MSSVMSELENHNSLNSVKQASSANGHSSLRLDVHGLKCLQSIYTLLLNVPGEYLRRSLRANILSCTMKIDQALSMSLPDTADALAVLRLFLGRIACDSGSAYKEVSHLLDSLSASLKDSL